MILACFCPAARAGGGLHPPPDGDYRNRNTAEGKDALFSLTTGAENTAIGFQALYNRFLSLVIHRAFDGPPVAPL